MNKANIIFQPDNQNITVEKGITILEAAKELGIYIQSVCGGDGVCGKCRVLIKKGESKSEPTGLLTSEETAEGFVLACASKVFEDIEVEIPPESRDGADAILLKGKKPLDIYSSAEVIEADTLVEEKIFHHSPLSTKVFLKLPPPTMQDTVSDLERVRRELKKVQQYELSPMQTGLFNIKKLGPFLRENNWEITVTFGKRNGTTELILFEPGDTSKKNYGVAVDIGTTTVVAHLVDLVTGKTLGTMGTFNKQISYGDDIITRIIFASEKEGLAKLDLAVTGNINNLISSLVREHKIKVEDITAVTCAGNTTMTHLVLSIDPTYIRKEPYVPTATEVPVIRAAEAGIKIHPRGLLACAPGVSSYVGGDVTAGILMSGMADKEELSLYIDMGTNGEMVLGNK
ncbi:MAG: 2Fe-2S iron-sulfur cluster binding domain-containing protein, partial [Planctomycetes bacterium]|nr:2Fe-2S iron-sulfur cluster binding domain-containing protein [Planctomycetota bacterium]